MECRPWSYSRLGTWRYAYLTARMLSKSMCTGGQSRSQSIVYPEVLPISVTTQCNATHRSKQSGALTRLCSAYAAVVRAIARANRGPRPRPPDLFLSRALFRLRRRSSRPTIYFLAVKKKKDRIRVFVFDRLDGRNRVERRVFGTDGVCRRPRPTEFVGGQGFRTNPNMV